MFQDEIQDFASTCIVNPPGPRKMSNHLNKRSIGTSSTKKHDSTRKRKNKDKIDKGPPRKGKQCIINEMCSTFSGFLCGKLQFHFHKNDHFVKLKCCEFAKWKIETQFCHTSILFTKQIRFATHYANKEGANDALNVQR